MLHTALSILQNQIRMLCDDCRLDIIEPLPAVRGNAQQLEQVFINVILNALQSLPRRSAAVHISPCGRRMANLSGSPSVIRVRVSRKGIRVECSSPFYHQERAGRDWARPIHILPNHPEPQRENGAELKSGYGYGCDYALARVCWSLLREEHIE